MGEEGFWKIFLVFIQDFEGYIFFMGKGKLEIN